MTLDIMKCSLIREHTFEYDNNGLLADDPDAVYHIAQSFGLEDATDEYLYLFCLDTKANIIGVHEISHGTLSASLVHPREVMKRALLNNAHSMILVHNHPSGDPTPSEEDYETTNRMKECGKLMGIPLLDHIIIGDGRYHSFKACDDL